MVKKLNFGQMSKNEFWEKNETQKLKVLIKIRETTIVAFLMKFGSKNGFGIQISSFQSLLEHQNNQNRALINMATTMMWLTPKTLLHFL